MILIEIMSYKGTNIEFYNGIDFDVLKNHAKDGSDGFIFCFMDSWKKEVNKHNRENKINSLFEGSNYEDFKWEDINNNYISIYQTDGIGLELLYQTVRDKVLRGHLPDSPYLPIKGLYKGAWKIEVGKSND